MAVTVVLVCKYGSQTGWGHLARVSALHSGLKRFGIKTRILAEYDSLKDHKAWSGEGEVISCSSIDSRVILAGISDMCGSSLQFVIDHPSLTLETLTDLAKSHGALNFFYAASYSNLPDEIIRVMFVPRSVLPENLALPNHKLLSGRTLTPLREEFYRPRPQRVYANVRNVFFCLGGSGQIDLLRNLFNLIDELGFTGALHLVVPISDQNKSLKTNRHGFSLQVYESADAAQVVSLMDRCDLGIVSAGTVAQECFARALVCGVIEAADDQKGLASQFEEDGLALSLSISNSLSFKDLFSLQEESWGRIYARLIRLRYQNDSENLIARIVGSRV